MMLNRFRYIIAFSLFFWSFYTMADEMKSITDPIKSLLDNGGQVALMISEGKNVPDRVKKIYFINNHQSQVLDCCVGMLRIKWSDPNSLLVNYSISGEKYNSGIRRISTDGKIVFDSKDSKPYVSWLETVQSNKKAIVVLQNSETGLIEKIEGWDIADDGFKEKYQYDSAREQKSNFTFLLPKIVSSPDGMVLAAKVHAGFHAVAPELQKAVKGLIPATAILNLNDAQSKWHLLYPDKLDSTFWPLLWPKTDTLYVVGEDKQRGSGLFRISLGDGKYKAKEFIYSPGNDKYIFSGTMIGTNKALLLVQDHTNKNDCCEERAKEIHVINFDTGKVEVLVRLPNNIYADTVDWIK